MTKIKKKDRRNAYLFLSPDGIWYSRVMIPPYMRGLFQGRTSYSKSSGTGDIIQARIFRDAMIAEFNLLREQVKPVTEKRIDTVLTEIKRLRKHVENSPDDFSFSVDACPTLRRLADIYLLKHEAKRKLTTLSKLNKGVELFLEFLNRKDVKLTQVNRTMVTNFIEFASKERATQTVRHYVANLGMLFDYASARYHDAPQVHLNPFRGHKLDTSQSESYQPFTDAELHLLLNALDGELHDLTMLGLYSGARLEELASLQVTNIIEIGGIKCFDIKEGKNKNAIRVIPIHSKLLAVVERLVIGNHSGYLFYRASTSDRADGKKSFWYSQAFTRARIKALGKNVKNKVFHSLRHNFSTKLDRKEVPEIRANQLLGHEKAKTISYQLYSAGVEIKELKRLIELVEYEGL